MTDLGRRGGCTWYFPAAFAIGLALFLAACPDNSPKQSTPILQPKPQDEWMWSFSRGMKPVTKEGDWFSFEWQPKGEADMLLKKTGPLSSEVHMLWRCGDCKVTPTEGSIAKVSLIIIGATFETDRLFWAGQPISNGGGEIKIPLTNDKWTNVSGQHDQATLSRTLSTARLVGLCFGDPGAGHTCHGASGTGKFDFTFSAK